MSVLWLIAGVALITVVASACLVFFGIRPMLARRVRSAATLLGEELCGVKPKLSGVAACEGWSNPARATLKGIGAMALTDAGLFFCNGSSGASVLIQLAKITRVQVVSQVNLDGRRVRGRRVPLLVISWDRSETCASEAAADHCAAGAGGCSRVGESGVCSSTYSSAGADAVESKAAHSTANSDLYANPTNSADSDLGDSDLGEDIGGETLAFTIDDPWRYAKQLKPAGRSVRI